MPKTICVDFDGVIHSYTSGWQGPEKIPDPPTQGAKNFLRALLAHGFRVVVCSARAGSPKGLSAIKDWFRAHDMGAFLVGAASIEITNGKPAASVYIDDRAWLFKGPGQWPDPQELDAFEPWMKHGAAS